MDNIYYHKYLNYKMKYLKLKEESGIESRCITWQKNYLKNVCIFSENKCLNL